MATRISFLFRHWAPNFGCRVPEYTLEGLLDIVVAQTVRLVHLSVRIASTENKVTPEDMKGTYRAIGFDMPREQHCSSQNLENLTGNLANSLSTDTALKPEVLF